MKKSLISLALIVVVVLGLQFVSADLPIVNCRPTISIINQDPYPANPNEYVRVVFQIDGLSNPNCESVSFELQEGFPFSFDPNEVRTYEFLGSVYARNFKSSATLPYKLRVDRDAIDGDNEIEGILRYVASDGSVVSTIEKFNINVKGVKVDFEISVREFDVKTNTLTFEILNIGEDDVVALTIDVPKQENAVVKGANRNIIGDLDANDDTTFKFEMAPKDGEITLGISYTDSIKERRHMEKKVYYDSSYFTGRKADEAQKQSAYYYLFWLLILLIIAWWLKGWWKRRKRRQKEREERRR